MNNAITIAIDAMGGDNSPNKVIEGTSLHSKSAKNVKYKIFGNLNLIKPLIKKYNLSNERVDLRFGQDLAGDLYLFTKSNGKVYKVVNFNEK